MNPNCKSRTTGCAKLHFFYCLSVIGLLATASLPANGQYYSPPTTIRTPYGNVTTPGTFRPTYYHGKSGPTKYKFTIVLKDHPDSVIQAKSAIYSGDSAQFLKLRVGGKKIKLEPTDTKEISRVITGTSEKYVGVPTDTCWLFKAVEGKITCYNATAEKGYTSIIAIQQGDGPILLLKSHNLEPMIMGHAQAMKYFEKRKYIKAIEAFNKPN